MFCIIPDDVPPDECSDYKVINDTTRSKELYGGPDKRDHVNRDFPTAGNWHRFMGEAGTVMPTSCVTMHHCGTHAPGWLEGSHPIVDKGAVTRKVCFHWTSNCCTWSTNIKVRNCGEFYVYKLEDTPVCRLRYCVENKGKVFLLTIYLKFYTFDPPFSLLIYRNTQKRL